MTCTVQLRLAHLWSDLAGVLTGTFCLKGATLESSKCRTSNTLPAFAYCTYAYTWPASPSLAAPQSTLFGHFRRFLRWFHGLSLLICGSIPFATAANDSPDLTITCNRGSARLLGRHSCSIHLGKLLLPLLQELLLLLLCCLPGFPPLLILFLHIVFRHPCQCCSLRVACQDILDHIPDQADGRIASF